MPFGLANQRRVTVTVPLQEKVSAQSSKER